MLEYLLLLALICMFVWLKKPGTGIPVLPGRLPVIGHALLFNTNRIDLLKRVRKIREEIMKQGGVSSLYFGPKVVYAITDPEDCAKVLTTCFGKFYLFQYLAPLMGEKSLFLSKVHIWKAHRKALNPAFNLQSLYYYMDTFNEQGRRRVQQLGAHGPGPFDHFHTFLLNILETSMQKCLLDFILDQGSNQFKTNEDIQDNLEILIGASYDTTGTILVYLMTAVGSYPEIQQKMYDEIISVVGNDDVTKDDLSRLVYMEAVIKETMRVYNIAPFIGRETHEDVQLKNYTIPKGSIVGLFMIDMNLLPVWGPDASQFIPERWLDPARLPENLNVYAPFSLGKRNCIGKTYAMMSMKTSLVHVLRHYKVTGDITKTEHKLDIMMKPASGHHISLEERK